MSQPSDPVAGPSAPPSAGDSLRPHRSLPVLDDRGAARTLDAVPLGRRVVIARVGGPRAFRRRLMEMGLVPGTAVKPVNRAPLGDPIELEVRLGRLSIRRGEAASVEIE